MSRVVIKTEGFKEFEAAIAKNPQVVYVRGREFLNRALMAYRIVTGKPSVLITTLDIFW
jgi:L-fucose mutarotase/ribose pyranase (RbsD/FucU family)